MDSKISRRQPVLEKAVAFLRQYIISHALKPGDLIAPLIPLARLAGVSYVTMHHAAQELKKAGIIDLPSGRRRFVMRATGMQPEPPAVSLAEQKEFLRPWQTSAESIIEDINNGVFRPGFALPSSKELQVRYAISYKTLRKSLHKLVSDEILDRLPGGAFAVPSFQAGSRNLRLVCVGRSIDSYAMEFGQNDEQLFRAIESCCELAHIAIDVYLFYYDAAQGRPRLRHKNSGHIYEPDALLKIDSATALGYVYFIPWEPLAIDIQFIMALIARKRPVAVFDETGLLNLPRATATSGLLRIFSETTSLNPAITIAHNLLGLGHRKAAFFSVDHSYIWSQKRLEGLKSAFEKAGHADGVVPYVIETSADISKQGARHFDFASLARHLTEWSARIQEPMRMHFDQVFSNLHTITCMQAERHFLLLPLFKEALENKDITAWVAVNDAIAPLAMKYLRDNGRRIPHDISLVSFDDSLEALRANFSSYNFNSPAIAAAVMGFMLNRKPYARPGRNVTGFLVDRQTTGPARQSAIMSMPS